MQWITLCQISGERSMEAASSSEAPDDQDGRVHAGLAKPWYALKVAVPLRNDGDLLGCSVAALDKWVYVGACGHEVAGVAGAGVVFRVKVEDVATDLASPVAMISSPNPYERAAFGSALAISGEHFLIGAPCVARYRLILSHLLRNCIAYDRSVAALIPLLACAMCPLPCFHALS